MSALSNEPAPRDARGQRVVLAVRWALGAIGVSVAGYGAYRILSEPQRTQPGDLLRWLIAAVLVHDGLIVPLTVLVGVGVTASVPSRARRYLQGVLIAVAVLIPPVLVEIYRRGSQPAAKALVRQNYALHLAVIAGAIAGLGAIAYLLRRSRDDRRRDHANARPSTIHDPE